MNPKEYLTSAIDWLRHLGEVGSADFEQRRLALLGGLEALVALRLVDEVLANDLSGQIFELATPPLTFAKVLSNVAPIVSIGPGKRLAGFRIICTLVYETEIVIIWERRSAPETQKPLVLRFGLADRDGALLQPVVPIDEHNVSHTCGDRSIGSWLIAVRVPEVSQIHIEFDDDALFFPLFRPPWADQPSVFNR